MQSVVAQRDRARAVNACVDGYGAGAECQVERDFVVEFPMRIFVYDLIEIGQALDHQA